MSAIRLPAPGARVGTECGPGEFARDNAGTVLCHITDRWGTRALVLMDAGKLENCEGLNDGLGIGWHMIKSKAPASRGNL